MGFMVVDRLGQYHGVRIKKRRFKSKSVWVKIEGKDVLLVQPRTYMNLSGKAIKALVDRYGFDVESVLVIHDDMDLPVGRIKIVSRGGAGGHRGVLSIMESLGSSEFPRIKIGIGRPLLGENAEEYVLEPFYADQAEIIDKIVGAAVAACGLFVGDGVERAMNKINCINFQEKEESS